MKYSILAVILMACSSNSNGGDSTGGACGLSPCGGDLVGDWTQINVCLADAQPPGLSNCPGAAFGEQKRLGPVAFELTADLKFISNGVDNMGSFVIIPVSCLDKTLSASLACYNLNYNNTPTDPSTWACTLSSDQSTCTCQETLVTTSLIDGTYSVSGTTFVEHIPGVRDITFDYCVQGNTMKMRAINRLMYTMVKQ